MPVLILDEPLGALCLHPLERLGPPDGRRRLIQEVEADGLGVGSRLGRHVEADGARRDPISRPSSVPFRPSRANAMRGLWNAPETGSEVTRRAPARSRAHPGPVDGGPGARAHDLAGVVVVGRDDLALARACPSSLHTRSRASASSPRTAVMGFGADVAGRRPRSPRRRTARSPSANEAAPAAASALHRPGGARPRGRGRGPGPEDGVRSRAGVERRLVRDLGRLERLGVVAEHEVREREAEHASASSRSARASGSRRSAAMPGVCSPGRGRGRRS